MSSESIVVFIGGHEFTLSIRDAQDLKAHLSTAISERLLTPGVKLEVVDGYFTRRAVYELLSSRYTDPHELRNHAGKLFGRLFVYALYNNLDIYRCIGCKETKSTGSCWWQGKPLKHWGGNNEWLELRLNDVIALSPREFKEKSTQIGPAVLDDFRYLKSAVEAQA